MNTVTKLNPFDKSDSHKKSDFVPLKPEEVPPEWKELLQPDSGSKKPFVKHKNTRAVAIVRLRGDRSGNLERFTQAVSFLCDKKKSDEYGFVTIATTDIARLSGLTRRQVEDLRRNSLADLGEELYLKSPVTAKKSTGELWAYKVNPGVLSALDAWGEQYIGKHRAVNLKNGRRKDLHPRNRFTRVYYDLIEKLGGDFPAALYVSYSLAWYFGSSKDGWCRNSRQKVFLETGLSIEAQKRINRFLVAHGLIILKRGQYHETVAAPNISKIISLLRGEVTLAELKTARSKVVPMTEERRKPQMTKPDPKEMERGRVIPFRFKEIRVLEPKVIHRPKQEPEKAVVSEAVEHRDPSRPVTSVRQSPESEETSQERRRRLSIEAADRRAQERDRAFWEEWKTEKCG